ncbi:MAG: hypothetical protein DCC43_13445 [Candidatus Brocadia sp.]|uniref:Uncharacterized protein n=1 Tax=Candidatus Brocadia fulgida TaxID=380242 RepID=A0A0M2UWQ6_9BACT|nr:MAG: hypothetical protein BROFUL_01012 [Candidatus Brocadia fulgida]MCC6326398.1 hypothetical protein [Candidatus Brocadia sp.]MCE7912828.1 hypothetical protein [Candidatus Brocadia sp. AMX3]MBV6519747.1 hypothetical protein [Candidatus Brocadia fulgida]RIJ92698.1 MAG: hypothetical protein DCC43_13445 [Candidatus Brocadia sp.]
MGNNKYVGTFKFKKETGIPVIKMVVTQKKHNAAQSQPKKFNHKERKALHKDHKENITEKRSLYEVIL